MTEAQTKALQVGSRVCNGSLLKGVVAVVSKSHVQVIWSDRHGADILCRTSPLWRFLEVVP